MIRSPAPTLLRAAGRSQACPPISPAGLDTAATPIGLAYPLDNALYQWEEGSRRLRELSADPRAGGRALRAVEVVRDELRRRIGATFTAAELAELYAEGTDWALEAARWAMPEDAPDLDPQAITDGAFHLHLRGAVDYAGGRLVPTD